MRWLPALVMQPDAENRPSGYVARDLGAQNA